MPKVRRGGLPDALFAHLLLRFREREIPIEQLGALSDWLITEPDVPEGPWFKIFPGMIICGEGELVKTFLRPGQVPAGQEVK